MALSLQSVWRPLFPLTAPAETHVPQPVAMFQGKRPKPPDLLESPGHLCLTHVRVQPVAKLLSSPGPSVSLVWTRVRFGSETESADGQHPGFCPWRWACPRHGLFAGSLCARATAAGRGPSLLAWRCRDSARASPRHASPGPNRHRYFLRHIWVDCIEFRRRNLTPAPRQGSVPTDPFSGCGGTFPFQSTSRASSCPGDAVHLRCGAWSSRPWRPSAPAAGAGRRPWDRPGRRLCPLLWCPGVNGASPRPGLWRG